MHPLTHSLTYCVRPEREKEEMRILCPILGWTRQQQNGVFEAIPWEARRSFTHYYSAAHPIVHGAFWEKLLGVARAKTGSEIGAGAVP